MESTQEGRGSLSFLERRDDKSAVPNKHPSFSYSSFFPTSISRNAMQHIPRDLATPKLKSPILHSRPASSHRHRIDLERLSRKNWIRLAPVE